MGGVPASKSQGSGKTAMPRSGPARGQGAANRPSLVPANPLPGWLAIVQVLILLGIPLTLLFVARLVLHHFFPDLGY